MKICLFFFLQSILLIDTKRKIYNCELICFGLETCIEQCEKQGIQSIGYMPQSNSNPENIRTHFHYQKTEPFSENNDEENENIEKEENTETIEENKIDTKKSNDEDEDSVLRSSASLQSLTNDENCGLRKAIAGKVVKRFKGALGMGRIVGGEDALPHEFPWQISMQIFIPKKGKVEHFCGGSILNAHWILTAAHCLDVLVGKESKIIVKMGTNKMMDESVPKYSVEKMKIHEGWNRKTQTDDIALMRIKEEMKPKINANNQFEVNTICLPEKNSEAFGTATLSGWGQTGAQNAQAEYLQKIDVPIYDQQKCAVNYQKYVQITDTKMCAGGKGGQDSCMGDSGGPLIQVENGKAKQIGVVSFGYPCAVKDMPGVYTKLSKYLDWIEKNID